MFSKSISFNLKFVLLTVAPGLYTSVKKDFITTCLRLFLARMGAPILILSLFGCAGELVPLTKNSVVEPTPTPIPTPTPSPSPTPDPGGNGTGGSGGPTGVTTQQCGNRSFVLKVPSSYRPSEPAAIVVAFHGLGDDRVNFYNTAAYAGWTQLAESKNFLFMVPSSTNPNRESFLYFNGNTFDAISTRQEAASVMDCVLETVGSKYNVDRSRLFWIGFSEGASFTSYAASYFSKEISAAVAYAGVAGRVSSAVERILPIHFITGTADSSYNAVKNAAGTWRSPVLHPGRDLWVNGVGHSFVDLNEAHSPEEIFDTLPK